MSQKTNLNVSPYYDDFDENKNFYKVLFKPGFPIQSRELTTLQSILQNQISSFANHVFKDGSVVIPGNVSYDPAYYAVKLNSKHLGLDIGLYINELVGKKISGQTSGVTATVQKIILDSESSLGFYTLYVKYNSSNSTFQISQFSDGETLITQDTFSYGNTSIVSGQTIASLISNGATSTASAVSISKGVYYIRGTFVDVNDDTLILDQYTNTPSYRVGLEVVESVIDAQDDNTLYDNARGFANFSAPGADRLKISATLTKKVLTDYDDKNFIEIVRVVDGTLKKIQDTNTYSLLKEYIAKRTYEESGDYSLIPFDIDVNDSLNDRISSNGLFFSNQKTEQGNVPSDNLLCVKVSPGKAYVKGFDIDKSGTTIIDVQKPRDVKTITSAGVPFQMGNLVKVNNVSGTPLIGLDNNFIVNLQNQRKTSNVLGAGTTIGNARVYSFGLSDAPYSNQSSQWDLYLFDVQTYTTLTLNQSLSSSECPETSFIKGLSSGASGYVVGSPSGNTITITQTSGIFNVGEQILINGLASPSRTVSFIKQYSTQDIKSIYQDNSVTGLTTTFTADTVLQRRIGTNFNINDQLQVSPSGIASCAGRSFVGIRSDAIIRYQIVGLTTETFNRVVSVSSDGIYLTLAGVSTVPGVCDGGISTSIVSSTFAFGEPSILNSENAYLYARLGDSNISDVNLSNAELVLNKQVTGKSTNNSGSLSLSLSDVGITSAFFETYDNERYSIFYQDGSVQQLNSSNASLTNNSTVLTFSGLNPNQSNVIVNTTVQKNSIVSKQKTYVRSEKIEISTISSGLSTSFSGLTTSNYYGLRVNDEEISLNVPDVVKVIAVYESLTNTSPVLDKLTFASGLNLDSASVLGEKIIGSSSGSVAQIVTRLSSTEIEFVYLNGNKFINGETINFEESNISAALQLVTPGNYLNRTSDFTLDKGQKEQYYDYSRIIRKNDVVSPSRRLLIIYDYYTVPSSDSGDVYTVQSYDRDRYKNDIPILGQNIRASDVIDFRPRVSRFTSSTSSPFAFSSRNFSAAGINPTVVVAANENSNIGYSKYLPRIDKLVLNKNGNFSLVKGVSAENPREPASIDEAMDVATIELPAYVYSTSNIKINLIDNKRYTMRDIGKLEQRIDNLETLSALSLLEIDTKSLQIQDADGLSRFKSGFFADGFKNTSFIETSDPTCKFSIDKENEELLSDVSFYSLKSEISPSSTTDISTADFSTDLSLRDPNVKKTGSLVTLNYAEVSWNNVSQNFATKEETINPNSVSNYNGYLKLTPSSDTWVRSILSTNEVVTRTEGDWTNTYISNIITGGSQSNYMRSRNVEFYASGLQPATQYYGFLDSNGNIDIIPKLIQITMNSGVFQDGEDIFGYIGNELICCFRSATQNHKFGLYSAPSILYPENPYTPTASLSSYAASSTVLNIDTKSLAEDSNGRYFGYVSQGMLLVGKTSGAQATVGSQTLITDSVGDLIGCFYIRNPLINPTPSVVLTKGSKTFRLSSSSTNSNALTVSFTETTFYASGIVNPSVYSESVVVRKSPPALPLNALRRDPLSQTFRTDNDGGFLTSVDLFFSGKDSTEKVFVEIRETDIGGTPKNKVIQDFARAEVLPVGITTSNDGSVATNVKFDSPIYLQPNKQYALSILCPSSSQYKVWAAESNQPTVATQNLPNTQQVIYSNNYTGGNLYKPQNGSIWSSSLLEDLKFNFYKAQFNVNAGTVYFHNPSISIGSTYGAYDANIERLISNPIKTLPRKLVVGIITSSTISNLLSVGTKLVQGNSYGFVEKIGGNIGVVTTTRVGAGYSNGTFSSVPLYTITGSGSGATADVTFIDSSLTSVSIANSGTGYVIGDVLGVTTSSVTRGRGATVTISSVPNIDTIYLNNVQGEEFTTGQTISYYNGTTNVSLSGTTVRGQSYVPSDLYSGNVFEVTHYNHGMHSDNNLVIINGVFPDSTPEQLTSSLTSANTSISIANTSNFVQYEGVNVSASNPGYVLINNEIISYTGLGVNSLTINQRGENNSIIRDHAINSPIYKYEINGVSLTRINTTHSLPSNSTLKSLRDIDKYHLEYNRASKPQLSFTDQRNVGGSRCQATQNYQFNSIIPQFNTISPENTNVSATLRTISGTSAGGNEISFLDQGFESVQLNEINRLESPRLISSRVNEVNRLSSSTFPNSKSLTLGVRLESTSTNVSPVIDLSEAATFILERNRVNRPILNYAIDPRSNEIQSDPHKSIYVSKQINLAQPATSLKVIVSAYRDSTSDFRVLYRLFKSDSSEISQSYRLFPGYSNLVDTTGNGIGDTVVDTSLNDGSSDIFVRPSITDEFLEYQFTANDLEEFNGFSIKIVMSGTNESKPVRFTDIRAIALA